jgi:hypothetical protein
VVSSPPWHAFFRLCIEEMALIAAVLENAEFPVVDKGSSSSF